MPDPTFVVFNRVTVNAGITRVLLGRSGATLLSFKGIGAYTAGAIRSFAFRERAAILDTNVARVLFRVFVAQGDPKSHKVKRHLWTLSETLVPVRDVYDFNQALMDFGAMVCVARALLGCCLTFRTYPTRKVLLPPSPVLPAWTSILMVMSSVKRLLNCWAATLNAAWTWPP